MEKSKKKKVTVANNQSNCNFHKSRPFFFFALNTITMAEKRKDTSVAGALIKRAKQDNEDKSKSLTLSSERSGTKNAIVGTVRVILNSLLVILYSTSVCF